MEDTAQMIEATKYNSIEYVRARVAKLHKAVHDPGYAHTISFLHVWA